MVKDNLENRCNHPSVVYSGSMNYGDNALPMYRCSTCDETYIPKSFGGTLDTGNYRAEVKFYNSLRLVKKFGELRLVK